MATQTHHFNQDSLLTKFGTEEAVSLHGAGHIAGQVAGEQCLEVEINLDELSTTDTVMSYSSWLPHDALLTHVRVVPLVSAVGTNGILDVGYGYFATAGSNTLTSTNINGILAAMTTATMAVGEISDFVLATDNTINDAYIAAVATGGDALGTEIVSTVNRYYIIASESDSNAFTGGVIKVQIYYMPLGVQKLSTVSELS